MKKFISGSIATVATTLSPLVAFAQGLQQGGTQIDQTPWNNLIDRIDSILGTIVPILIAGGFVYFVFGLIQYITAKEDDKKKESRSIIIQGIVIMFVILAIWGIVELLASATGIQVGGSLGIAPGVEIQ